MPIERRVIPAGFHLDITGEPLSRGSPSLFYSTSQRLNMWRSDFITKPPWADHSYGPARLPFTSPLPGASGDFGIPRVAIRASGNLCLKEN